LRIFVYNPPAHAGDHLATAPITRPTTITDPRPPIICPSSGPSRTSQRGLA
jgi:hypothetical protein